MENDNEQPTDSEDVQDTPTRVRENRDPDPDPADEIPVPIAMSPEEVAERAEAVQALRQTPPALSDDELQP
jgi:hypothetical protein